ncbi:TatD family hydrolase [Candidatus Babeliales bacterium]|nr:TatD family hydrolase [Candidatus Babeliales bacterium]
MNIIVRNFQITEPFQKFTHEEIEQFTTLVHQANINNVTSIINVGTNYEESVACVEIAKIFPNCYATLGIHPNDIDPSWPKTLEIFNDLLKNKHTNKIVGIGECGIDKHYPDFNLHQQQEVFHAQITMALDHNVALVIHSRDADQETYQALAQYKGEPNLKGTIHCFSSNQEYAEKYIELGFVLGFGGTMTYPKNETLRSVAKTIPLSKIILETDAPFLSPQAVRGTRNVPANILLIAQYLAELRNESEQHVMQTTTQTASHLFGIVASS